MSFPFDATLKEIVSQAPADFRAAFRLPNREPVMSLNVDLSTISAATDVALGFGDPLQEVVDLNFQASFDSAVAARLHLYNAALHLRFGVPVRSILVLMRAKADHRGFTGKLAYVSGGNRVVFEYEVVRLWQMPAEVFLQGGVGLLPLATLCKMPPGSSVSRSLQQVVSEIERRLAVLPDHARAVRLMSAAFTLLTGRLSRDTVSSMFQGVKIMHKTTLWDEIEEAEMKTLKRVLISQGQQLFGDPSKKERATLTAIQEIPKLERMALGILTVKSWKELLSIR